MKLSVLTDLILLMGKLMNKDGPLRPGVNFRRPVFNVARHYNSFRKVCDFFQPLPAAVPGLALQGAYFYLDESDLLTVSLLEEPRHLCSGSTGSPTSPRFPGPWKHQGSPGEGSRGRVGKDLYSFAFLA